MSQTDSVTLYNRTVMDAAEMSIIILQVEAKIAILVNAEAGDRGFNLLLTLRQSS